MHLGLPVVPEENRMTIGASKPRWWQAIGVGAKGASSH